LLAGEGSVPRGVGGCVEFFGRVDLGCGRELWMHCPVQRKTGVLGGVVIGVLGREGWVGVGAAWAAVCCTGVAGLLVRWRRTVGDSAPVMLRFWMSDGCKGSAWVRRWWRGWSWRSRWRTCFRETEGGGVRVRAAVGGSIRLGFVAQAGLVLRLGLRWWWGRSSSRASTIVGRRKESRGRGRSARNGGVSV